MTRVSLNVSGNIFETELKYFVKKPSHRLSSLVLEDRENTTGDRENATGNRKNTTGDAIVVERPADSFAAILAYYQTGELHLPTGVCPGAFRGELEYWGIGADQLSECCVFRYCFVSVSPSILHCM